MKHIRFVSATKGKKEDTPLYQSTKDYELGFNVLFYEDNTKSLQEVYNDAIKTARIQNLDVVVLLHDDIFINDKDFLEKVKTESEKYPVFGVAGAASCTLKKPALWHLMSERKDHRGVVAHGNEKEYHDTVFGPMGRALLIDGVLIGINIKKLPPAVKFDENYPSRFHYYDLDFSLECNKKHIKIGVVELPIIHSSPGLTDPDEEFYKGQEYFINKWKR